MTMTPDMRPARTAPLHLWIVAVVSLLWNLIGVTDYTMTNLRSEAYLNAMGVTTKMMDMVDAFPAWSVAAWALGVWGAFAGSLLLMFRSRFAVHAFAASLMGLAITTAYQASLPADESLGFGAINVVIWAIAIALLWYARRQRQAGVLR